MSRPFICVGDRIDHGGSVVSGSPFTDVDGKPVARIGDRVVCSKHGPTSIVTGDATTIIDGQPVACHGDKTACGATLISSQVMAFTDGGGGGGASGGLAASAGAAAAAVSAALAGAEEPETAAHFTSGDDPGDPQKARDAVRDANAALTAAGAYRPYDTEVEAAQAWREHVLPVADDHQVEIGANISRTAEGKYHLDRAYSSGAYNNVTGLVEHGPKGPGEQTATIHTHPMPGGLVGSQRAFDFGEEAQAIPSASGHGVDIMGGSNLGSDGYGDLPMAYYQQLNTYIADSAGLHGWSLDEYRKLQQSNMQMVPLGEAYRTY